MKKKDIPFVEDMLFSEEKDYVSACARYLTREELKGTVWLLSGKKGEISALIINSRSTVIPVLCGRKEIPDLKTLKGFLRKKKIHSLQGIKDEVLILEDILRQIGRNSSETTDYDLMSLDRQPKSTGLGPSGIVLYTPRMTDLDSMAPLQAAYEQEEVLPRGSDFNPAASRVNMGYIIANGRILAAQFNGRLVGKINVSAVSFTRYLVGGVYIRPEFRGLGIARRMAHVFITSLINEGRGVTLFVKKANIAACRLYASLGFSVQKDYRITYYINY